MILHDPARNRFEYKEDGMTAYVEYEIEDAALDVQHTWVPKPLEGRGIAAALVKAAYEYATAQGLARKATCPYAVLWLERHP